MDDRRVETGIGLARAYWSQVVRPILQEHRPAVPRAAGRIGTGSDVLGLDDEMSRDHDWGLRLQVFVPETDRVDVLTVLGEHIPAEFFGLPTRFAMTGQSEVGPALDVLTVDGLVTSTLGFDPRRGATSLDWLSVTGQAALELTAGLVFEDQAGDLSSVRDALTWYPDDVWRYVVACDWRRIDHELPLLGRAGHRDDDLGSRLIAARLVDVAVHLAYLLSRRWAPYSKWRGTLLRGLPTPGGLKRQLADVLDADDWHSRTSHLVAALEVLASMQRDVGLPTADPVFVPFWDRPFVHVDPQLVPRLLDGVSDAALRALPPGLGSIEQRTDNIELLMNTGLRRAAVVPSGDG